MSGRGSFRFRESSEFCKGNDYVEHVWEHKEYISQDLMQLTLLLDDIGYKLVPATSQNM